MIVASTPRLPRAGRFGRVISATDNQPSAPLENEPRPSPAGLLICSTSWLLYSTPIEANWIHHSVMELLVFSPDDFHPRSHFFDGPVMVGVQQAIGESPEPVPGFTSISRHGAVHRCVAYYDRDARKN